MAEMTDAQVALMAAAQPEISSYLVLSKAAQYLEWLRENSE